MGIVKALLFIHQPDQEAPKASDVSAADWLYQHTWKNIYFFHVCCYGFSQGQKTLYNTAVYVINRGYYMASLVNREGFAVHSSNWPSGAKGVWRVSSWLSISTHVKKKNSIFFHVCCSGFSQGRKFLYDTAVYVIIRFSPLLWYSVNL